MAIGATAGDAVPAKGSPQGGPMFSLRIVNLEYYLAPPLPGMDVCYSKFQGRSVVEVPVVRIYGSTPGGQKACLHLHQVFPYFYVPYDDDLSQDINEALAYVRCLASAIEKAMKLANSTAAKKQHVHSCSLVRAHRYYGYYPNEQIFIKIVLYHPQEVGRISALLQGGGLMNRKFQPHEAHIPYLLQLLIDQNLSGMSHLHLSSLKFRHPITERPADTLHIIQQLKEEFNQTPQQASGEASTSSVGVVKRTVHDNKVPTMEMTPPSSNERSGTGTEGSSQACLWVASSIPANWTWPSHYSTGGPFGRHSTCELEADASVEDILNRRELLFMPLRLAGPAIKLVQSLMPMWEEERRRTGEDGPAGATSALRPSAERFPASPSSLEQALRDSLFQIIHEEEKFSQRELRGDQLLMSTQEMLLQCTQAANIVKRHVEGQDELEPRLDTRIIGVQEGQEADKVDQGLENSLSGLGCHGELFDEHIVRSQFTQHGHISQDAENEVAELLGWMGAGQEDPHEVDGGSEDDETEEKRRAFSQVWESPSMEAAMLQALSEFEHPTQRECRAILDCVNNNQGHDGVEEDNDSLEADLQHINFEEMDSVRRGNSVHENMSHCAQEGEGDEDSSFRIPQIDGAGDGEIDTDFSPAPKRMRLTLNRSTLGSKKEESQTRQMGETPKRSGWGSLPVMGVSSQPTNERQELKVERNEQVLPEVVCNRSVGFLQHHKESIRVADVRGHDKIRRASTEVKKRAADVSLRALMRKQRERQLRQKDMSFSGGNLSIESISEREQSSGPVGIGNHQPHKDPILEDSESQEDETMKQKAPPIGLKFVKHKDMDKLPQKVVQNPGTIVSRDVRQIPKFGILPFVNSSAEASGVISSPKRHTLRASRIGSKRQLVEVGLGHFLEEEVDEIKPVGNLERIKTNIMQSSDREVSVKWGNKLLESGDHRDCGGGEVTSIHLVKREPSRCSQVDQANSLEVGQKEAVQLTLTKEYEELYLASTLGLTGDDIVILQSRGLNLEPAAFVQKSSKLGDGSVKTSMREGSRLSVTETMMDKTTDGSVKEAVHGQPLIADIYLQQETSNVSIETGIHLRPPEEPHLEDECTQLLPSDTPHRTQEVARDFDCDISEDRREVAGPDMKQKEMVRKTAPMDPAKSQLGHQKEPFWIEESTGGKYHGMSNTVERGEGLMKYIGQDKSTTSIVNKKRSGIEEGFLKEDHIRSNRYASMFVGIDQFEVDRNEGDPVNSGLVFTDMSDGSKDSFDWGDDFGRFHRVDESDEGAELSEEEIPLNLLPNSPSDVLQVNDMGIKSESGNIMQGGKTEEYVALTHEDVGSLKREPKEILDTFPGAGKKTNFRIVIEEPKLQHFVSAKENIEYGELNTKGDEPGSVKSNICSEEHGEVETSKRTDTLDQMDALKSSLLAEDDLRVSDCHLVSSKPLVDQYHFMNSNITYTTSKSISMQEASHISPQGESLVQESVGALNIVTRKPHGKDPALQLKGVETQEGKCENLIAMKLNQKPPSREALMTTLEKCGLRGVNYGGVFYGNLKDVPVRPIISAGLIFDVKSKEVQDLPPFLFGAENQKSIFDTKRLEEKYKRSFLHPGVWIPSHFENDGTVSYLLTPARLPPSRVSVQKWLSETHDWDTHKHSSMRGERVFTMDANTGKLVPISDIGSKGLSQESFPMRDPADEDLEYLRPASPKYDEKHVLATPTFNHGPSSPVYGRYGKKSRKVNPSPTAQVASDSRSPHVNTTPVTSKEATPVNSQSSGDVMCGKPNLLKRTLSSEGEKNISGTAQPLVDMSLLQASLQTAPLPAHAIEYTPPQPAEDVVRAEVSREQQPDGVNLKVVSKSPLRWRDVSQITAPSPEKGQLTPLSQSGFQDPASVGAGQQVTLMSIEVHSETRGNLRPDPRYDAIGMVVIVIQHDGVAHQQFNDETVVLIVDAKASSSTRNIEGVTGCNIIYLPEELILLKCFVSLVRLCDPDILVGWEIQGYSLGLLAERSANLGFGLLKELSRTPPKTQTRKSNHDNSGCVNNCTSDNDPPKVQELRNSVFGEKIPLETVGVTDSVITDEWGRTHGSGLFVGGRIILNLWRIMRGEVKLGIYSLEAVAEAVLRRRVPRIPWRTLTKWFARGPAGGRFRCIEYFIDRAQLNFQIMDQLDLLNRTAELARVFGIDFFSVLSRGSQYRVESMMLRLAHTQNFLLLSPSRQQVAAQPAMECLPLVMEPESRFYTSPVVVLDFQSLYPSMIIAYNLCFSTCLGKIVPNNPKVLGVTNLSLRPGLLKELKDCLTITPNGVMYTPPEVCQGVIPRLLSEILSTRIMVKQAMKKLSPDQRVLQRVLNARQFALKLIANVTYGYTAAGFSGRMPCAELADSIVQCGRLTLERAIHLVNTEKRWDARVVYGDTDSMFVLLEGRTREEAFKIGQDIAASVTAMNPNPVTLKMEKVYHPCVLLTKKRYVGYSYENPGQLKPTFDAKGIETIRRDSCAAVAKTLEQSLRTLFETQDLSQVKEYLQRQWGKIISGRVSLRDFIFAKEVRLGTYSARASVLPAAAIVASKAMSLDPRAEPRYAERVPYVVVHGEPGARLSDVVVDPHTMLANGLRLHDTYYITKQIIPALQRVFGLVGADLRQWYTELPRVYRPPTSKRHGKLTSDPPSRAGNNLELGTKGGLLGGTIDQYYLSQHCSVCGELMPGSHLVCKSCAANSQAVVSVLTMQTAQLEKEFKHLETICRHCGGADGAPEGHVACISLDCPIFFERVKTQKEAQALSSVSAKCGYYPRCFFDFGSELF